MCLLEVQSNALHLPERSERAFLHIYMGEICAVKETEKGPNKESEESNAVLDFDPIQLTDFGQCPLPSNAIPLWLSEPLATQKQALLEQHSKLQSHHKLQTIYIVLHILQFCT